MSSKAGRLLAWLGALAVPAALACWRPWAGLGAAAALAAWIWSRESSGADRLRRFLSQIEAGDFSAGLPDGHGGLLERLKPACESMASALGGRFAEAEELRRRLLAAFNGMNEGVALCDSEGAVLLINPAFRRLAGFEEPILRRCFLWEAVRDPQLNAAAEEALKKGRSSSVDLPLAEGRIEGRALVAPVEGQRGSGAGVVVFLFDRTEERKVERLRSEFVANVSHELRTPMAAIKAALETLRDGALDDPAVNQVFLGKAVHHSERLEELLSDLLALSRIEEQRRRGLGPAEDVSCSVAEAWAEASGSLEPAVKGGPAQVLADLPPALPRVRIEKAALRQILLNYVENALKYAGPEPRVLVGAKALPAGLELWVQDDGPGVPEADLPRVFERFFRVERARTRGAAGGSGLGLSIVKHLAENAGGQVGAENLAKGCRFWVRLKAV